MPLGFDGTSLLGIQQHYGDALSNEIERTGQMVEQGLKTITTNKQLDGLAFNLSQIDPEKPGYLQSLVKLGGSFPLAMQDPRGQTLIALGAKAHQEWQIGQRQIEVAKLRNDFNPRVNPSGSPTGSATGSLLGGSNLPPLPTGDPLQGGDESSVMDKPMAWLQQGLSPQLPGSVLPAPGAISDETAKAKAPDIRQQAVANVNRGLQYLKEQNMPLPRADAYNRSVEAEVSRLTKEHQAAELGSLEPVPNMPGYLMNPKTKQVYGTSVDENGQQRLYKVGGEFDAAKSAQAEKRLNQADTRLTQQATQSDARLAQGEKRLVQSAANQIANQARQQQTDQFKLAADAEKTAFADFNREDARLKDLQKQEDKLAASDAEAAAAFHPRVVEQQQRAQAAKDAHAAAAKARRELVTAAKPVSSKVYKDVDEALSDGHQPGDIVLILRNGSPAKARIDSDERGQ